MKKRSPARVRIAVSVVLAAAAWAALAGTGTRGSDPYNIHAVEARFEEVRRALPERGVYGYLRDPQAPNVAALPLAQYALAPRILVENQTPDLVIADFQEAPWRFTEFIRERRLRVLRRFGPGLYLVARDK